MANVTFKKVSFLMLAATVLLAGCSSESDVASEVPRTIVVGMDDSFPPMNYLNAAGEFTGYDVDLAKEVAARLKCDISFYALKEWNRKEALLNAKDIDCIWSSLTITAEREKAMLFTPPYLENFMVLMVRDDAGYTSAKDLKGKVLGMQTASSAEYALEANDALRGILAEKKLYPQYHDAVAALENGEVDGVVVDSIFAENLIFYHKKPLKILDDIIADEQYGIAFRLGDEALRDSVWNALKAMEADGTVADISRKWFGQNMSIIK